MLRRAIQVGEGGWRASGEDGFEAAWPIRVAGSTFELRTAVRGVAPPPTGAPAPESALAAALLPAMRRRRPIRFPGPASPRLLSALPKLQETLRGFFPALRRVRIRPDEVDAAVAVDARGTGLFLSLGIDSFYSLLLLGEAVTDLVLVRGFDAPLYDQALWQQAVAAAEEVAAWTDTRLVLVRTNVRELLDAHVAWSVGHGAALAHVGLLLTPWLQRAVVATSHHAEPYFAHGSHPELDPLWSTEALEVVHHGQDARRIDTLAWLARQKVALDHLRVCRMPNAGVLNCGRCARCLLATLGLEVVDALEHCKTLPHDVPDGALRSVERWSPEERVELEALRDAWRESRPGSQTLEEIRAALARSLAEES